MLPNVLKSALILDTETTGLARGSGITELGLYDLDRNHVEELLLTPNYVATRSPITQDITGLASSPLDTHEYKRVDRWIDVFKAKLVMDSHLKDSALDEEVLRALAWSNKFTSSRLEGEYSWLLRDSLSPLDLRLREQALKLQGYSARSRYVDPTEAFGKNSILKKMLDPGKTGKTLWIANTGFEAKQIGAQLAGLDNADEIKSMLETASRSPDPFYVTGEAVNRARVVARRTGDWTSVWRAYVENTPKAGELAVRDIIDVARATMSYMEKLGLSDAVDKRHGLGMDVLSRLIRSASGEGVKGLQTSETHKAALDAADTETLVLKKLAQYNIAMEEVLQETETGQKILREGREGRGILSEIASFAAQHRELRDDNIQKSMFQRLERAHEDLLMQNKIVAQTGTKGVVMMEQTTPSGAKVKIPRQAYNRETFSTMDDYLEFLEKRGDFEGYDLRGAAKDIRENISGETKTEKLRSLKNYVSSRTAEYDVTQKLMSKDYAERVVRAAPRSPFKMGGGAQKVANVLEATSQFFKSGKGRFVAGAGLAVMGGLALAGAGAASTEPKGRRSSGSIVAMNYYDWEDRRIDGMQHNGEQARRRKMFTDFGSPYNGPQGSSIVFHDQALLEERERFLRMQYRDIHFDPEFGIFSQIKSVVGTRAGYGYEFPGGNALSQDYAGLNNKGNLREIDVSRDNWKMHVEDADTLVIQRGGVRGFVSSFFGMNKRYKFRLEGIDSTEVTHGPWSADGGSYHAPQPYAMEATEAARQMLSGKDIKIVFDPTDSTYGRSVATVFADGQNYNIEAVKRGYAAFLPYGKQQDSMLSWSALESANTRSMNSKRGMWSTPWAQVYGEYYKTSGNSITFNTFTRKNKIVKNKSTMDLLSLMEQAESQGFMSNAQSIEAARLSKVAEQGTTEWGPAFTGTARQSHYSNYIANMTQDTNTFMRTKGTNRHPNKFSRRNGYGELDSIMAVDSMGTTNSVWTKRRTAMVESYELQSKLAQRRKQEMAEMQRRVNQTMFDSPINHHVM